MKYFATLLMAFALAVPALAQTTYPSSDGPIDLVDGTNGCAATGDNDSVITSTITVTDAGVITDLDVQLNIDHTWVGDLTVVLEKGGTSANLIVQPGDPEDAAACGDSSDGAIAFVDDEGADGTTEDAPAAAGGTDPAYLPDGRYTPNSPLSAFDGMEITGAWSLSVTDDGAGDLGTLNSWALIATLSTVSGEAAAVNWSHIITEARPNPFSASTQIGVAVSRTQAVHVSAYDMTGREIAVLHTGLMAAEQDYALSMDRGSLSSGVYVIRIEGEDFSDSRQVTVIR